MKKSLSQKIKAKKNQVWIDMPNGVTVHIAAFDISNHVTLYDSRVEKRSVFSIRKESQFASLERF